MTSLKWGALIKYCGIITNRWVNRPTCLVITTQGNFLISEHKRNTCTMAAGEAMWSFGFGSNMDVEALQAKKHVTGWRLAFRMPGIPLAEPAFASIVEGNPTDEVHGVAFKMTPDGMAELDRTEAGYDKKCCTLATYDGREVKGFVYVNKPGVDLQEDRLPSSRYLGVLVKGAKQAGLNPAYIAALEKQPTSKPSAEVLALREKLPKPETLPAISAAEMQNFDGSSEDRPHRVAVLGYVFATHGTLGGHRRKDVTTRMIKHLHGLALDDTDDGGLPPYPLVRDLTAPQREYLWSWVDHYLRKSGGQPVAYIREFLEQQNSGATTWALPKM